MYAKIFRQIYESSIAENPTVRFTFMDLLVLSDKDGIVDMTHESIARITNRPLEEIRETIAILESPDPRSRNVDDDGRRIRRLDDHRDWGWVILNYDRFREIATEDNRREKTRERMRRLRERARKSRVSDKSDAPVTHSDAGVTPVYVSVCTSEGTGTDKAKGTFDEIKSFCRDMGLPDKDAEWFFHKCESNSWTNGGRKIKDWRSVIRSWKAAGYLPSQKHTMHQVKPHSVFELKTIIEAKQKLAESIKNTHCRIVATGPQWDSEDNRKAFLDLKKQIRELTQQLASM